MQDYKSKHKTRVLQENDFLVTYRRPRNLAGVNGAGHYIKSIYVILIYMYAPELVCTCSFFKVVIL